MEHLLAHLAREEDLLADARDALEALYQVLRTGDLPAIVEARRRQEELSAGMRLTQEHREGVAAELARHLGLPTWDLTLTALAERLPEPAAGELRSARDRMRHLTEAIQDFHRRNANLVECLRSYFRGVLSDLMIVEAPLRYGPSGAPIAPPMGAALYARG